MAVSQGRVLESLEKIVKSINPETFVYDFLEAYGFPKATVTKLRNGDKTRNVATVDGDVALKKHIYFRVVPTGTDLEAELEKLSQAEVISRHQLRFPIVTDLVDLVSKDLAAHENLNTPIAELDKVYTFFLPLSGYEKAVLQTEHPADVRASEKMGQLFDLIRAKNDFSSSQKLHALNVFLTRLLFCFYAEDTGIFQEQQMTLAIKSTTSLDGHDLAPFFERLFKVLNLPLESEQRQNLPAMLRAFPYVNGGLFRDEELIPEFSLKARKILLECGGLNWADINPDIFGSMFQSVIEEEQRGNLGQHYTSVSNIMKVIQPLFLDDLWSELSNSKNNESRLKRLLIRLQSLRIFDPACGSGNFLIIAYKELRRLEMAVIDQINDCSAQREIYYSGIKLSQFYGIEIDDFAHEVAILSLWLAEHQMNTTFKEKFGLSQPALPLSNPGNIVCENSLRIDWTRVCPINNELEIYICGNPPFLGSTYRTAEQNEDMEAVFASFGNYKKLDYVASWFVKAAAYIRKSDSRAAFVATNSISQGMQAEMLWSPILVDDYVSIDFAFTSFPWRNNAKQNAAVHVVIVGIATSTKKHTKRLFRRIGGHWHSQTVQHINPYLVPSLSGTVRARTSPFDKKVPLMKAGNKAVDGGYLYLSREEAEHLLDSYPMAKDAVKRAYGADEFLNGKERYCLWIVGTTDTPEIHDIPIIHDRIESVREVRLASRDAGANALADRPHQFRDLNNPEVAIIVPSVTSERRKYAPVGFVKSDSIVIAPNLMIPGGGLYEAGVLMSDAHMDWLRTVAGRLKSDYRYSAKLVYNTFPWPQVTDDQKKTVEDLAEEIFLIREDYPDKNLADLYDPNKMPDPLKNAHQELSKVIDGIFYSKGFTDSVGRLEFLFKRYNDQLLSCAQVIEG